MKELIKIIMALKSFIIFTASILTAIFGLIQFGKKKGKEDLKNDLNQETINNFKKANDIRQSNSKLTRNELIDKL